MGLSVLGALGGEKLLDSCALVSVPVLHRKD